MTCAGTNIELTMAAKEAPHIVVMSKAFLVLRIFQIIFALIPLGICIFGVIYVALDAFILNIFTVRTHSNKAWFLSLTAAFRALPRSLR